MNTVIMNMDIVVTMITTMNIITIMQMMYLILGARKHLMYLKKKPLKML